MPKVALVAVADRAVRKHKDQQKQAFSHIFEKPLLQTASQGAFSQTTMPHNLL
jgi:hypothetical protein